jgi:hypothetical protein
MSKYEASRRRKHFVPLRLDDAEYQKLKEWSSASHRTMSGYLRELLADCQPVAFPPIEYQEVLYELRKIGINLNQIAGKAHSLGFVDEREYGAECDRLWRVVAELSSQMSRGGVKFGNNKDMGC